MYEAKNIPKVVITLVALGEFVPQTCPAFKGPQLNMSKFSWTTSTVASNHSGGQAPRRTSSGRGGDGGGGGGTADARVIVGTGGPKASGEGSFAGTGAWTHGIRAGDYASPDDSEGISEEESEEEEETEECEDEDRGENEANTEAKEAQGSYQGNGGGADGGGGNGGDGADSELTVSGHVHFCLFVLQV